MHLLQARAVLLLFLSTALYAQDASALVHRVDDHYNRLSSLQTRYTEHYTGLGMDRTESGTLLLKKPGRMRWSYDTPTGKVFLLDGKNGWFYTPGDSQVQRVSTKQLDDLRSPLRFLLGHTQLNRELDALTVKPAAAGYEIAGVPKGMAQRTKLLTLGVDGKGLILFMRLEEVDGAVTEFTFYNMRENVAVKDTDFQFSVPPGVSIVDGLPPI